MAIKKILAPIEGGNGDAAVLDAALAVARRFGAHVEVLHVSGDPRDAVPFLGEGASGALIEQIMTAAAKETQVRAERAKKSYETWRNASGLIVSDRPGAAEGASAAWRHETGGEDEWIAKRGRLADLIVVPPPSEEGKLAWTVVFESALLDSGRPVLAVGGGGAAVTDGSVAIAWNASVQAARAISGAMPFLAGAKSVTVISVHEGGKATPSSAELVNYLAWHGIRAEAREPEAKGRAVGAAVLAEAAGASLLVMGAYTHNRVREMIFGGVTRHVLEQAKLPVLMAH